MGTLSLRANMSTATQIAIVLILVFPFLLSSSCQSSGDCDSGCCSGYGHCIGQGWGWACQGRLPAAEEGGKCREDKDCPSHSAPSTLSTCCSPWGWCTTFCSL